MDVYISGSKYCCTHFVGPKKMVEFAIDGGIISGETCLKNPISKSF